MLKKKLSLFTIISLMTIAGYATDNQEKTEDQVILAHKDDEPVYCCLDHNLDDFKEVTLTNDDEENLDLAQVEKEEDQQILACSQCK